MPTKRTKIVATIGPASDSPKVLRQLLRSGMDVARLNFSHGTNEERIVQIKNLRSLADEAGLPLAIIGDLSGPKLRLGTIPDITVKRGEKITLSTHPETGELPIQYDFAKLVKVGQRIFLNDALVALMITKISGEKIETKATNTGMISSHKGINLPDTSLPGAAFSAKDAADAQFALTHGIDYLALSFVERASDLEPARKMIAKLSPKTKIIVKVERAEAINNLDGIIRAADAVMVARGDLATETSAVDVPILTQKIIRLCRQNQKPVIVATQMLESMMDNPRPTRAEASDVAAAVLIQADAVMLSGETARGTYPVETVQTMRDIILSVEKTSEFRHYIRINWETLSETDISSSALVSSAASIAYRINAPAIAVATASGRSARLISSFRPSARIIAVAHDDIIRNQLNLLWGVYPVIIPAEPDSEKFWKNITNYLIHQRLAKAGDAIVIVGGSNNIGLPGATNTIKMLTL